MLYPQKKWVHFLSQCLNDLINLGPNLAAYNYVMDEETIPVEQPVKPKGYIFKDNFMLAITMLGGPITAGYIIACNFKVLGDTENEKRTWVYTGVLCVAIMVALYLLRNQEKFPPFLIPIIYSAIANSYMRATQHQKIEDFIKAGGQTQPIGHIIVAIIGGIIAFVGVVFAFLMIVL
jgi:hypothetical protein